MSELDESITTELSKTERQNLLGRKLCEMPLAIPGSHLEAGVNRLYDELDKAGITFRPGTYLSDSWGCPSEVPIIGIPFYLADAEVYQAVNEFIEPNPWDNSEIIKYLRHECGHAMNYAYLWHEEPEWEKSFGPYEKTYKDNYKSIPFDTHFVRHSDGWYAQKHPDEDFAETFAVWLAPDSNWREVYKRTPALFKLEYIDSAVGKFAGKAPEVTGGDLDRPLSELDVTLLEWCRLQQRQGRKKIVLPGIIDEDLRRLFPDKEGSPAADFIEANNRELVRAVHDWTGIGHYLLYSLTRELTKRVKSLGLKVESGKSSERLMNASAFVSTLAMNYQYQNKFVVL
jgi:hypothetical protein